MTTPALGALVGVSCAGAVLLLVSWGRARRPLALIDRIGPYAGIPGHLSAQSRHLSLPARRRRRTSARRAPRPWTPGLVGALVGAVAGGLLTLAEPSFAAVGVLAAVGAMGALWGQGARARAAARARARAIEEQVPVLADLLALGVSAGATPVAAMDRAARHLSGPLGEDITMAMDRVRSGEAVESVLIDLGGESPSLSRLVESMLIALDRGTPLSDVLRAQALDARADERRRLMESAGRKDVAMLVPIVFLVLPSVVLIALFPAVRSLEVVVS